MGFVFAGFNIVGAGYLSATEHALGSFVTSIMRGLVAIILCALVMAYLFGFTGVWLSFGAAEAITAILTIIALFFTYKKVQ